MDYKKIIVMKRVYSIFILSISLISCSDFLDVNLETVIEPEEYFTNYSECQTGVNGALAHLSSKDAWGYNMFMIFNGGNDEIVMRDETDDRCQMGTFRQTPDNCTYYAEAYVKFYEAIHSVNNVLAVVDSATMSDEERDYIKCQSLFIRAYSRLQLATLFGGIIISNDAQPEMEIARSSQQVVFDDYVIPDMLEALDLANEVGTEDNEIDQFVIKSFLAWTYNYLATAKVNEMGKNNWDECALNSFEWVDASDYHAKALVLTTELVANIATYGKELIPEYNYLFRENTKTDQQLEFIWTAPTTVGHGELTHRTNDFGQPNGSREYGGGNSIFRPTIEMYRKYAEGDIRRDNNIGGSIDTELQETIYSGLYYCVDLGADASNKTNYVAKYRVLDPETTIRSSYAANCIDFAYMRLPEIYFMHAEALYYSQNDETTAREQFKPIRLRAAGFDDELAVEFETTYYKDDFIEELLDERSREFFSEGKRRLDLFRFGSSRFETALYSIDADEANGKQNYRIEYTVNGYEANPKKIWGPIPIIEMSSNKLLVQNPGY